MYIVLVLLVILGLIVTAVVIVEANNEPGYGPAAGGFAVAIAILLHALVNLRAHEQRIGHDPKKKKDHASTTPEDR
jgi:peptidoglycan/LPS O-acetylase OafA/YrhL